MLVIIIGQFGVVVFGANLTVSAFVLAGSHDAVTALNTALNFASWYILINAQRKLRTEVTPKLDHVEEQVAAVAEQINTAPAHAIEGGRRQYDPPPNGEAR